ncbi:hypothetical protein yaldo0001_12830 [Yersinia aldovae ATCC 35236]|nr:hypothetical protein yaldo0001_12830 [Yersinia aldovae ATCC 35236]
MQFILFFVDQPHEEGYFAGFVKYVNRITFFCCHLTVCYFCALLA